MRTSLSLGTSFLAALSLALSTPSQVRAFEARLGTYVAEGPGALLEARHRFGKTDLGIHLAGSTIELDVITSSWNGGSSYGYPGVTTSSHARVTALFYEAGLILGHPVYTAQPWELQVNSGLQVGLLDGTMDMGLRPLATTMLLIPLHLDATVHPFDGAKRLGFLVGAGVVWTRPGDEDNLYPEVSPLRFQARAAVLF